MENCSASTLVPIIKKLVPNDENDNITIYTDEWKTYDGLVNVEVIKNITELNIVMIYSVMVKHM